MVPPAFLHFLVAVPGDDSDISHHRAHPILRLTQNQMTSEAPINAASSTHLLPGVPARIILEIAERLPCRTAPAVGYSLSSQHFPI